MANNLTSNVTDKVARVIAKIWESTIVLSKTVDTQSVASDLNPSSGDRMRLKRPHDYNVIETTDGDISAETKSDIIAGTAEARVQDYLTIAVEWTNKEEALQLDQLEELLRPMVQRECTKLELNLGTFMQRNLGLSYGAPGTAVSKWSHVAGAGSLMQAMGVPQDGQWHYVMNPFTTMSLADTQSGLASGSNSLVDTAWQQAQITNNFGGLKVMTSNCLQSRTASASGGDRVGAIHTSDPLSTYAAHKDSMIQTWNVDGFTGGFDIKAGEIIEVTGKHHLSLATRQTFVDETGAQVKYRGVVTQDATLVGGAGAITVAGAAINEANGQYNTIDTALADGDVITLLGADGAIYQPNLFFHKQAIGLGFVKLPKLYSTDTVSQSKDGFSFRVSKYSDGDKNKQKMRIDILPVFGCFNPFYGGQGFGSA